MQPTILIKNQFGEQSNATIVGGTSQLSCNFIVDSTNSNGLGIRSLKGSANQAGLLDILNVYMHTSATPAVGNPNPASGIILVKFRKAFTGYVSGSAGFVAPVSGTPINITSGLSVGTLYVITTVGSSTAANFQALGLPVGVTPAVGVAFVATSASAGTGTGVVEVMKTTASGVSHLELIGDPNKTLPCTSGGYLFSACLGNSAGLLTMNSYTPAGTNDSATPPIFTGTPAVLTGTVSAGSDALATPSNETVVGLTFVLLPTPGSQI